MVYNTILLLLLSASRMFETSDPPFASNHISEVHIGKAQLTYNSQMSKLFFPVVKIFKEQVINDQKRTRGSRLPWKSVAKTHVRAWVADFTRKSVEPCKKSYDIAIKIWKHANVVYVSFSLVHGRGWLSSTIALALLKGPWKPFYLLILLKKFLRYSIYIFA